MRRLKNSARPLPPNKCQLENAEDPAPEGQQSTAHSNELIAFRVKDIKKLPKNLQPDKVTGLDGISARVLKECSAEIAQPSSQLFNLCFSHGVFQSHLKTALVIPIHNWATQNQIHPCTGPSLCFVLSARSWSLLYRVNFRPTSWITTFFLTDSLASYHTTALLISLPSSHKTGKTPWTEAKRFNWLP